MLTDGPYNNDKKNSFHNNMAYLIFFIKFIYQFFNNDNCHSLLLNYNL